MNRYIRKYGITEFIVCTYGGFDQLAAQAVMNVKQTFPNVKLQLFTAGHPEYRPVVLPEGFDGIIEPAHQNQHPKWYGALKSTRQLIDDVDYIIIYNWQTVSHVRELVEYAKMREIKGLLKIEEIY
ncbi:MAG: hypothetical protein E7456_06125 [Ruminococcaceae bacterium]|nr:hypothetical protein [Oscillospiraceae bacterium]